jgi:hypothetical protein
VVTALVVRRVVAEAVVIAAKGLAVVLVPGRQLKVGASTGTCKQQTRTSWNQA